MTDPVGLIGGGGAIPPNIPRPGSPAGGPVQGPSFKDVLFKNIEEVNRLQQDATTAIEDLQAGRRADLEGVLLATAKADTAFQLLQAVRNKVVQAYEEIKQMRV